MLMLACSLGLRIVTELEVWRSLWGDEHSNNWTFCHQEFSTVTLLLCSDYAQKSTFLLSHAFQIEPTNTCVIDLGCKKKWVTGYYHSSLCELLVILWVLALCPIGRMRRKQHRSMEAAILWQQSRGLPGIASSTVMVNHLIMPSESNNWLSFCIAGDVCFSLVLEVTLTTACCWRFLRLSMLECGCASSTQSHDISSESDSC